MTKTNGKINYVEIPTRDIKASMQFFTDAFAWSFVSYGPDYAAIEDAGLDGGFYSADVVATAEGGSVLVVLYSTDLESSMNGVRSAGGKITREIFDFPGGRRFHFSDPSGNEYAVWSEPDDA